MAVLLIIITLLLMLIVTILSIPLTYTVRLYITSPFKATATVNWSGRVFCFPSVMVSEKLRFCACI